MARTNLPQIFSLVRGSPELIAPARPTPHELKPLSDIDDQQSLRFQVPVVQIYPPGSSKKEGNRTRRKHPGTIIKKAIAEALVYYYPFAGRLREGPGGKLSVDCTAEGVVFVEAEANFRLQDMGDLRPPFCCFEELLFDLPGSSVVLHSPLLLIQVTRLRCGGSVLAMRLNHTMSDAAGLVQFLKATAEIARGASQPSILPIWSREILCSRDPPRVTCLHHEYEQVEDTPFPIYPLDKDNRVIQRSFFLGLAELSAIRKRVAPHLKSSSVFDLVAAFLWQCRTIALHLSPHEKVRLLCIVNARNKFKIPLPKGYYGNVFAFPAAVSTMEEITSSLDHTLELIQKTKAKVTEEYMRSVVDHMSLNGRPFSTLARSWIVSDTTRAGFLDIDFGWVLA